MSSAPLERLAVRQAGYSQQQGEAEERMLGNLAEIPDMAMRTRERIQRMQLADAAAQMRAEAVEQKRMEVERRMYEASALYKLRTEQAAAQSAKISVDAAKLELDQKRFEWQKTIGEKRETRLGESMDDDYYTMPVRHPETGKLVMRVRPGVTRPVTPEEEEYYAARMKEPAVQNELREAQAERARRGPVTAAKSPLQRFQTATQSVSNLSRDLLMLPTEEKAKRMNEIKAMHAEMEAAMKEMEAERNAAPVKLPDDLRGILNEEQWETLRQSLDEATIRERLKKAGRLK